MFNAFTHRTLQVNRLDRPPDIPCDERVNAHDRMNSLTEKPKPGEFLAFSKRCTPDHTRHTFQMSWSWGICGLECNTWGQSFIFQKWSLFVFGHFQTIPIFLFNFVVQFFGSIFWFNRIKLDDDGLFDEKCKIFLKFACLLSAIWQVHFSLIQSFFGNFSPIRSFLFSNSQKTLSFTFSTYFGFFIF